MVCDRKVHMSRAIKSPAGVIHKGCFRCYDCQRTLSANQYRVVQRKFYCEPPCDVFDDGIDQVNHIKKAYKETASTRLGRSESMLAVYEKPKYRTVCLKCAKKMGSEAHYMILEEYRGDDHYKCQKCNRLLSHSRCTLVTNSPIDESSNEKHDVNSSMVNLHEVMKHGIDSEQQTSPLINDPSDKRSPSRATSVKTSNLQPRSNIPVTCVADAEKVAMIQKRLEAIQSSALEGKTCYICGKRVYPAEQLNMLERIYHVNCFRCKMCNKVISNANFQVFQGNPYCIPHYKQISALKSTSTLNLGFTAFPDGTKSTSGVGLNKNQAPIFEENLTLQDDSEIFQTHSGEEFVCCICSKNVNSDEKLNVMRRIYHRSCFKCNTCQKLLSANRFGSLGDIPYCDVHYKALLDLRRSQENLSKPNETNCDSTKCVPNGIARFWKNTDHASENHDMCYSCGQKVYCAEKLCVLKRTYHKGCFKCGTCQKVLTLSNYDVHEGVPYCNIHHQQLINKSSVARVTHTECSGEPNLMPLVYDRSKYDGIELSPKVKPLPHSKTRCFNCTELTNPTNSLILMDRVYHLDCLKCTKCDMSLGRWNYKEIDGLIYCPRHHTELTVTKTPFSVSRE